MKGVVAFCLNLRWAVLLAALGLMGVGYVVLRGTKVDAFPEFAPPHVEVQTEAPGLSTLEVEQLVTQPIENVLNGTPKLATLRSKSVLGLSSVVMFFEEGTDLFQARQFVQERLGRAGAQLPQAARAPIMLSPLSATSRVLEIGVTSKTLSQMEMSDAVRWTVRPKLLAVPGVANVAIWGERDRQVRVQVDPARLRGLGISVDEVTAALQAAIRPSPGGFVDTANQRLAVVHEPFLDGKAPLSELVLRTRAGTSVRLADVAQVDEAFPPPIGDAVINGKTGLLLIVEKQPWGNTLEVTRRVEAALEELAPATPGMEYDPAIFRPATFVERSLRNLGEALGLGCILVVLVLAVFLYDWRTAVISVVSIPLSLVAAALVMHQAGLTLNTMAIAGLAIALGEVVDDAIIDVENILRRLRENAGLETPRAALRVVLEASLEVRSAVVYASLIVVLVFLPVFFLDGLAGAFFRPLALSYVLAVGASLVVALTLTPALSLLLLGKTSREARPAPLAAWARRAFTPLLGRALGRPKQALGGVLFAFAAAGAALPFFGESFLPDFKETDFLMHWVGKPGTSLEAMRRTTLRVSQELLTVPGVRHFGSHIGRAEVADEVVGPNFAELWISLDDSVPYDASVKKISSVVEGYPGIQRDVQTYLEERVKEVLTGASGSLVVRLYGTDLDVLRERGAAIGKALGAVPGVTNLKVEPQVTVPQVSVRLRPSAAASLGLSPGELQRMTALMLQGSRVGELYREGRVMDVIVTGQDRWRSDVSLLREMPVWTAAGTVVRLGDVADVTLAPSPNIVSREGASRRLDVTCDAAGRDLGAVARDIQAAVDAVHLPAGHHAELLGAWTARGAARSRLIGLSALALFGIGVILYADFRSLKTAALVFATLPFALVGGVAAVGLTGGVISLGSTVGFVTVLGIAARNGIMLVSHYRHLASHEEMAFGRDLVLRGTRERLVPILMTALATGLALLPLALRGDRPGYEIEHPMSVVILGGLVSSTAMNLLLLPSLYLRWGRAARPELDDEPRGLRDDEGAIA
jgi:CzcA family heavy metal efflux pump